MAVQGGSLGDLYSKCVQLVNENKISTKNAFELPLIDHMDDIVDSFMGGKKAKAKAAKAAARPSNAGKGTDRKSSSGTTEEQEAENRFHEASCTIEASARIYACRVDCVHTDTYRILGGLNSADAAEAEDGTTGEDGKPNKRRRIVGVNTLEKNEANLVQQNIEADEQSDPMFRRMAAAFDAGGAKGLLLGHLPVAEDLSLVFNGDTSMTKAIALAAPMFATPQKTLRADAIGLGEPRAAAAKIESSKLCPEVDGFRRQLWGAASANFVMPKDLENLFGGAVGPGAAAIGAASQVPLQDFADMGAGEDMADFGPPDMEQDVSFGGVGAPSMPSAGGAPSALVPLADASGTQVLEAPGGAGTRDDVVAFDELFDKFCGGKEGSNQYAYFDACWSKIGRDKDGKVLTGALADAQPEGAVVPAVEKEGRERQQKRPLFDLTGLDKAKPIETEPVAKHQLSERAAQWQLHKDVPPYMIDRITMPSWQTWSKCDFACLGLRPHLMLKLVQKPPPPGEGPHGFAELFSTVVVENPEAFPWLASESKSARRGDEDDEFGAGAADHMGDDGDEDYDASGLPAHLDVDPQELFLGPDDKVVPGCDGDDHDMGEDGFAADGLDFELADAPTTAENIDIGFSRNSKFVDVKLVKKHLWNCIEQDISGLEDQKGKGKERQIATESFQDLVQRTVGKMPKGECENLSAAVCFICALHLCNEKDLELKTDPERPLGDFAIVAPP